MKGGCGVFFEVQVKVVLDKLCVQNVDNILLDCYVVIEGVIIGLFLVIGNKVMLFIDGLVIYVFMQQVIQVVCYYINMEIYIMEDDEVGCQFVDLLIVMQKKGVQVNLMYDSVGSINILCEFFQFLIDVGVYVLEFNLINLMQLCKDWVVNQCDYCKLLVVDGKIVFVGGINISSVYFSGFFSICKKKLQLNKDGEQILWCDMQVCIDGLVVLEFQKLFIEIWGKQCGFDFGDYCYFLFVVFVGNEIVCVIGSLFDDFYSIIYVIFILVI